MTNRNVRFFSGVVIILIGCLVALSTSRSKKLIAAHPEARAYVATSVVDCLASQGMSSSFDARRSLAEADIHKDQSDFLLPYKGTADQNRHLMEDYCGVPAPKVGYKGNCMTTIDPKVPPESAQVMIEGLIQIAKENGLDTLKFVGTAIGESGLYTRARGDTNNSRGIFQIHRKHHRSVTDDIAFDWKKAAEYSAKLFREERISKNGKKISGARLWTCYRDLFPHSETALAPIQIPNIEIPGIDDMQFVSSR